MKKQHSAAKIEIDFTRINNDINGNPRYVCHFLNLIKDCDKTDLAAQRHPYNDKLSAEYELAIFRAKKIGGRKYHTKSYGGGIVFQSYNLDDTKRAIINLLNEL